MSTPERRVAVVTGGSRGIGASVVRLLAARGWHVVAVARSVDALAQVVEDVRRVGGSAEAMRCDITDEGEVNRAFEYVGAIDVLVNNAGAAMSAPVHRATLADWTSMLQVNATGSFLCTRAALPSMRERGWGRIVMIGSTSSVVGMPYTAAYTAAKHAVVGLMRVVAAEVAGTGITANAVCPTYVRSEMTEDTIRRIVERTGKPSADVLASLANAAPLGRLVECDEVAETVAFLCSDAAAPISGQAIVLDGGGLQR